MAAGDAIMMNDGGVSLDASGNVKLRDATDACDECCISCSSSNCCRARVRITLSGIADAGHSCLQNRCQPVLNAADFNITATLPYFLTFGSTCRFRVVYPIGSHVLTHVNKDNNCTDPFAGGGYCLDGGGPCVPNGFPDTCAHTTSDLRCCGGDLCADQTDSDGDISVDLECSGTSWVVKAVEVRMRRRDTSVLCGDAAVFTWVGTASLGASLSNVIGPDCTSGPGNPGCPAFTGGTAVVQVERDPSPCCPDLECAHCSGCVDANKVACAITNVCCTPDTIRATVSSVADCIGTCISGTSFDWKLTGTVPTAVNRTIDLAQDGTNKCKFLAAVASDHVLHKYDKPTACDARILNTTYNLSTLTYRMTLTSGTNWHAEVFASGGGETVYFFDGNVTITSGLCTAAATANNALSCALAAATRTAGNSGTFAKPGTLGGGTACGNCTIATTPASFSATIASVTTCLDSCVTAGGSNDFKLTGSTAINRSITLNQVGGSPCVFEGTVAADYVLKKYDKPPAACNSVWQVATYNIATLTYTLTRTGSTTATWAITGTGGGATITYATGNSAVSANDCANWGDVTHDATACSATNESTPTARMGHDGATVLEACP